MAHPPTASPEDRSAKRITRRAMKAYYPNHNLPYHVHALPEHGVVYVKNPKAGCSTALVWLSRIHTGDHSYSPSNVHQDNPLPRAHKLGWPQVGRMLGGEAYRFTFVRDPLRRAESAYRDKIVKAVSSQWRDQIRASLGMPDDEPDQEPPTFEQFITGLERQDPVADMDPHWRPQHVNLMHPLIEYDHIGKLETFDEDLSTIRRKAGLPDVPVEKRNVRATPDSVSVYDGRPDLAERVRKLFATDFELYGY